jgi:GTP-binding protein
VVVLVNKWDAIEKDTNTMIEFEAHVREQLKFMPYVPVLFISALTGQRVNKVLEMVLTVYEERNKRVTTAELNRVLADVTARHAPPSVNGVKLRFRFATQAETSPPTFIFFVNNKDLVHFTYERYLENNLRGHYGFTGTPIRLRFRDGDEEQGRKRRKR